MMEPQVGPGCIPREVSVEEIMRVTKQTLEKHPKLMHDDQPVALGARSTPTTLAVTEIANSYHCHPSAILNNRTGRPAVPRGCYFLSPAKEQMTVDANLLRALEQKKSRPAVRRTVFLTHTRTLKSAPAVPAAVLEAQQFLAEIAVKIKKQLKPQPEVPEFPAPPRFPWHRKPELGIRIISPPPSDRDRVASKLGQKLIEMECLRTDVVILRGIIARREVQVRMPLVQFVAMLICGAGLGLLLGMMLWHSL
jgi:hypothetical protein